MRALGHRPGGPLDAEVQQRLDALIAAGRAAPSARSSGGAGDDFDDAGAHRPPRAPRRVTRPGRPATWRDALRQAVVARGVRLDPGRRAAAAVTATVAVIAVLLGWRVLAERPRSEPVPVAADPRVPTVVQTASPSRATIRPSASGPTAASVIVVVDVVGRVRRPGLVRLRTGSRVDDAVRSAGGALPGADLTGLNLARILVDGEQIAVGVSGAPPGVSGAPPGGTGPVSTPASGGATGGSLVNLNTATLAELDGLPGVGPVLAQRILDWRTEHGRFAAVDQLADVSGIGDAKFADLKSLVTV